MVATPQLLLMAQREGTAWMMELLLSHHSDRRSGRSRRAAAREFSGILEKRTLEKTDFSQANMCPFTVSIVYL